MRKHFQPTKKQVMTDDILKKGHYHVDDREEARVCDACGGYGWVRGVHFREECTKCNGEGVLYD